VFGAALEDQIEAQRQAQLTITRGHNARNVLADRVIQDFFKFKALTLYGAFLSSTTDEERRRAHDKALLLEELYDELNSAVKQGQVAAERMLEQQANQEESP
jgi:hypothetical protein